MIKLSWPIFIASHLEEIRAIEAQLPNFRCNLHTSRSQGRIGADVIADYAKDLDQAKAYFCGPKAMRLSLASGLGRFGLSSRRFHYEEFEIRSGVGLKKLAAALLAKTSVK